MMDEEEISESVVSMNTVVTGNHMGMAFLERLRLVNDLMQQDPGQGDGPRVLFKVTDQVQHRTLVERFTVGRAHTSSLRIDDSKLSREHMEITQEDRACTVRDLDSKNGITVNNEAVTEKVLTPGDVITAGKTTFVYVED